MTSPVKPTSGQAALQLPRDSAAAEERSGFRIAIACGGTGGHFFPGLAVAEQLARRAVAVTLLISPKDVDQEAVKAASEVQIATLPAAPLQRGSRLAFLLGCWRSWRAARRLLRSVRPQAALAMGGFTAAPTLLAAKSVSALTFIHESNTIPGRANRWLAPRVDHAFVGFPSAAKRLRARRITVTGTPVRGQFVLRDAAECRAKLGLQPSRPLLLVMGGSQGASAINELVTSALPLLGGESGKWQFLHLTGPNDAVKVRETYESLGVSARVEPFLEEMDLALAAATAAVSRAGASSLAELAAMRVPSLLIPFPFAADNHQLFNARAFAESGAAKLLDQKDATPARLAATVAELIVNRGARESMQKALAQWHAPKAAEEIADIMLRAVTAREDSRGRKACRVGSNANQDQDDRRTGCSRSLAPAGSPGVEVPFA